MPASFEQRSTQRRALYHLLSIFEQNRGRSVNALSHAINAFESEMEAEDITHVRQKIAQEFDLAEE